MERYKAHLVAKGYTQVHGVDYFDCFSPVAKLVTVRFFISLATLRGWEIHQLDVNNAFLHGNLSQEVYMHLPQGYSKGDSNQVCRLLKSLYGLKQASREWNIELCSKLSLFGLTQPKHDHCLFTMNKDGHFLAMLVYVDDVLLTSSNPQMLHELKGFLDQQFTIKDSGLAKYFLGMEIARTSKGTYLCQNKYILDIVHDAGFMECKPVSTPLPHGICLKENDGSLLSQPDTYRRLIGRLLYLNMTRPDVSYHVQ